MSATVPAKVTSIAILIGALLSSGFAQSEPVADPAITPAPISTPSAAAESATPSPTPVATATPKSSPTPAPVPKGTQITLTHDKAIQLAIAQNPEVLLAKQEIERTYGVIIEVRAEALPRATLLGNYEQQDRELFEPRGQRPVEQKTFDTSQLSSLLKDSASTSGTGASTSGTGAQLGKPVIIVVPLPQQQDEREIINQTWRVSLEVRQLIYAGGQVRAALNIAKFTQDKAYFELRDTIDSVISQVRTGFYRVLLDRSLIKVQEESLKLTQEQLEDQRNRFAAGTVARFNVLRAEVEVANVEPDLIRARNDYQIAQWRLARLLGISYDRRHPEDSPINVVGGWRVPPDPAPLAELLPFARRERAFLKVQRQNLLSAREQIRLEQAGYKPRLEAYGGYMVRNSSASIDYEDSVTGWYFGAEGSWAIFDGLATYGRVKQARAQYESAKITFDDAIRQVDLEVQESYSNVERAKQTLASQAKNVESAEEALRLATERLAAGAGTQLDVLDARTALTQAQVTELQARFDLYDALSQLDRATGMDTTYLAVPGAVLKRTGPEQVKVLGKGAAGKTTVVKTPKKKWWWSKPAPQPKTR